MAVKDAILSPEMKDLSQFEAEIEKLKVVFEQYFAGVEKKPPVEKRDELQKFLRQKILQVKSNNTAYKFKRQTMEQKFVTMNNYWTRVLNEIEEGTYIRLKKRAALHEKQKAEDAEEMAKRRIINEAARQGKSVSDALKEYEARKSGGGQPEPAAPGKPGVAAPRAPVPAGGPSVPAASPIDRLHEAYMAARTKTGEANVDRAAFTAMIQKQIPAIKQKFNCKSVEFKVVVEDGKTKLKAIPKN